MGALSPVLVIPQRLTDYWYHMKQLRVPAWPVRKHSSLQLYQTVVQLSSCVLDSATINRYTLFTFKAPKGKAQKTQKNPSTPKFAQVIDLQFSCRLEAADLGARFTGLGTKLAQQTPREAQQEIPVNAPFSLINLCSLPQVLSFLRFKSSF